MTRPPSAYRMEQAMSALMAAVHRLRGEDVDLASDESALADLLGSDPETCDAMDLLHRMVRATLHAESMEEAADRRLDALTARRNRYTARTNSLRGAVLAALEALDMRKLEMPEVSVSVRAPRPGVLVTDDTALPDAMWRTTRSVNKAAIRQALEAGENVPGAVMANGAPSLQLRSS